MILKKLTAVMASLAAAAFIWSVPEVFAYDDLELVKDCGSHYGYDYLAKCSNPEGRQRLYRDIYDRACEIWQSNENFSLEEDGRCIMAKYRASDYGFSSYEDLMEVALMMKYDNPALYFVSNHFMYNDNTLWILIDQEYVNADVRKATQDDIYNYVIKTSAELDKHHTAYDKAKAMHDKLIDECEYELNEEGQPSKRHAAHNILGMIEDKTGVCDSYAMTFSLMMNYEDVNCICVSGSKSDSRHKWNMAKLDDGKYYYFDCSFDENLSKIEEVPQDFFLAAGTEKISLLHSIDTPDNRGLYFLYALPNVPMEDYDPDKKYFVADPELGDVNMDGVIDIEDAVVIIGYINGNSLMEDTSLADINGDNTVDIEDAVKVIAYVNGTPF